MTSIKISGIDRNKLLKTESWRARNTCQARSNMFYRAYAKKKGALAFGLANIETLNHAAPKGARPADMLPRVKSVISIGVGGGTRGS